MFVRDKAFYKNIFSLTLAIVLQNLVICSVNLADNIMIGSFSESALSGVAILNQIQFLLQMIILGITESVVVLASQYWGKRELEPIRRITAVAMYFSAIVSFVMMIYVFFFTEGCVRLFTDEAPVIAEGVSYGRIICFTYVFFGMTNVFLAALRSVEVVRIGFISSLLALFVNISLNYILIFGKFGFPRLGSSGAAIATLIARICETIFVFIYVLKIDDRLKFFANKLRGAMKIDRVLLGDYVKVGTPVVLSNTLWGLAMAIQSIILGHMGSSAIAANSISATVFQIISVVTYGIAAASSILIGKTVGEGDYRKVRDYTKTLQILFLGVGIFSGLALYFVKDFILGFYNISADTLSLTSAFVSVLSVTLVGTSYQVPVLTGIVRGGGDTKFVLFNDMIFMWLLVLPLSAICAFIYNLPPVIVFMCLKCDQILKCFVAVVKVNRFSWIKKLTR